MKIRHYLEDIENRIDLIEEQRLLNLWKGFVEHRGNENIFVPVRNPVPAGKLDWPKVNVNDAILDPTFEMMLLGQLCEVNTLICSTKGNIPMIRANYGCNILPTIMGCQLNLMERECNTLPGALPISGGISGLKALMTKGLPDLESSQGKMVFECVSYFKQILSDYPKLQKSVKIYHPDFQGVLDICEVLCGSEIFLAFYDDPEFVCEALAYVTEVYIAMTDRYFSFSPAFEQYNFHYGWMHKGKIRISLDSCMNFSPDDYRKFMLPCDKRLINRYGGIIHSCGKVDHFVSILPDIGAGYYGFNMSQPEYNDMETVLAATIDRGISLYNLNSDVAGIAVAHGRNLKLIHSPGRCQ